MLSIVDIREGACYFQAETALYVAWSMLGYASRMFWRCEVIQELDHLQELLDGFGKRTTFADISDTFENMEGPVLDSMRIVTCFENYFKAKLLLQDYAIHEMDKDVCARQYPQFMEEGNKKRLSQITKPIPIQSIKEAEQRDAYTRQYRTLTKQTIGLRTLLHQANYQAIYSTSLPQEDERLLSVIQAINATRNTLHFLSVQYLGFPASLSLYDCRFLQNYVQEHIDTLFTRIGNEREVDLRAGKDIIDILGSEPPSDDD